jgi:hypothetical protein
MAVIETRRSLAPLVLTVDGNCLGNHPYTDGC